MGSPNSFQSSNGSRELDDGIVGLMLWLHFITSGLVILTDEILKYNIYATLTKICVNIRLTH